MKTVLKKLFESKKFTVALATVIVWLVSLLGFNVSPETVMQVLSPLYAYILAQGVADMNPNNKKPVTPAAPVPAPPAPDAKEEAAP